MTSCFAELPTWSPSSRSARRARKSSGRCSRRASRICWPPASSGSAIPGATAATTSRWTRPSRSGFELGRGCGSTAWCYSLWTAHNWWLGHFPERCQEEFFATGPDTLFSSGLNPAGGQGRARRRRIQSLGTLGLLERLRRGHLGHGGRARRAPECRPVAPPAALRLPDRRHVVRGRHAGKRQQGHRDRGRLRAGAPRRRSRSLRRRGHDRLGAPRTPQLSRAAPMPGRDGIWRRRSSASPRAPSTSSRRALSACPAPAAPPIRWRSSSGWPRPPPRSTRPARCTGRTSARSSTAPRAAKAFTELDRIRYRRDKAFISRLCVRAVDRLFEGSGARAVMDAEPIQRCHRDAHGASHHAALSWDLVAEQYGRQAMGVGQ